jgi:hypothetical protein
MGKLEGKISRAAGAAPAVHAQPEMIAKFALFGGASNWKSSMFWPHRHDGESHDDSD